MADLAVLDGSRFDTDVGGAGNNYGRVLTASATVNTKGSWVAFWASTPFDADGLLVHMQHASALGRFLVDVGFGAVDDVRLSNLVYAGQGTLRGGDSFFIPFHVPAGTQVRARCQASVASLTIKVGLTLFKGGLATPMRLHRATTYGAETADSTGISVDPGGTANVKGSWAVLSTSTGADIRWLVLMLTAQANGGMASAEWAVDIGVGAAGAERIVYENLSVRSEVTDDEAHPLFFSLPASIPAGSRLVVRSACTIINATDRLLDAAILGLD